MSLDFYLEVDAGGEHGIMVYDRNITHNLIPMWHKAGVYHSLYECQGRAAADVIEPLTQGLLKMESEPEEFNKLNAPNGWGRYEHAVEFLRSVKEACEAMPKAVIRVSR